MSKLILMRHGQSQWNLENRFTGFTDVPLTDLGIAEAKEAGQKIKAAGFKADAAFTSTLSRAKHTAQLALAEMQQSDLTLVEHDDLRERDYGGLTGLNKAETIEKYGAEQVLLWRRSYDTRPPVGDKFTGESLQDVVEKRVTPYFKQHILPLLARNKTVLVAAHGNTVRGVLVALGIYNADNIATVEIPTGVPLVVTLDENLHVTDHSYL